MLLDSLETPTDSYLIEYLPFESCSSVNSAFVLHTADDLLRQFDATGENFALLSLDVARYVSLAGKRIKKLHFSLMHVASILTYYIIMLCECVLNLKILMTWYNDKSSNNKKNKDRKNDF